MIKQRFHIRQKKKKKEKKCITKAIFQIKPFYSDLGMRIVKVEGFELDLTFFFFFGSIFNLNSFPLINLQLFFSAPWLESLRCFFFNNETLGTINNISQCTKWSASFTNFFSFDFWASLCFWWTNQHETFLPISDLHQKTKV